MLDKGQIQPIFAMRTNSCINEPCILSKAETNSQGWHNGESPSARSRFCLGFVRGDHPSLLIKILLVMRTNKSENPCTPSVLIESLSPFEPWSLLSPAICQTLNKLLLAFLQSDLLDAEPDHGRREIVYHVHVITHTINTLKSIEIESCPENEQQN